MRHSTALMSPETQLDPATVQQRLELWIAFEALGHARQHGPLLRSGAELASALQRLELASASLPFTDKTVGAQFGIGAQLGLKLHRTDDVARSAVGGFADEAGLPREGGSAILATVWLKEIERPGRCLPCHLLMFKRGQALLRHASNIGQGSCIALDRLAKTGMEIGRQSRHCCSQLHPIETPARLILGLRQYYV